MKNRVFPVIGALLVGLFVGCSEHTADPAAVNSGVTDFGVVQVSDGTPIHRDLGGGRACVITPTVQTNGGVALDFGFEKSGKLLESPKPRILAIADRPVFFSFDGATYQLTPHLQ